MRIETQPVPVRAMASNFIPDTLADAMRWAPTYFYRKIGIVHNLRRGSECFLICGKLLVDAKASRDWTHDGTLARNFYEWVEGEIGIKRTNAQRMMTAWESIKHLLPEQMELITQIDSSKLAIVASKLGGLDPDKQIELLHSARELSFRALEDNIREINGGIAHDSCSHAGIMEAWTRCPDCGKFIKQEAGCVF